MQEPNDKVMRKIERYAMLICHMETARTMSAVSVYRILDEERASLHDQILREVKSDRADEDVSAWLSGVVEEILPEIRLEVA